MMFAEFMAMAKARQKQGERRGQALINALGHVRPELGKSLPDDIDPFYNETAYHTAVDWIRELW